jgi:hypothetical protein
MSELDENAEHFCPTRALYLPSNVQMAVLLVGLYKILRLQSVALAGRTRDRTS